MAGSIPILFEPDSPIMEKSCPFCCKYFHLSEIETHLTQCEYSPTNKLELSQLNPVSSLKQDPSVWTSVRSDEEDDMTDEMPLSEFENVEDSTHEVVVPVVYDFSTFDGYFDADNNLSSPIIHLCPESVLDDAMRADPVAALSLNTGNFIESKKTDASSPSDTQKQMGKVQVSPDATPSSPPLQTAQTQESKEADSLSNSKCTESKRSISIRNKDLSGISSTLLSLTNSPPSNSRSNEKEKFSSNSSSHGGKRSRGSKTVPCVENPVKDDRYSSGSSRSRSWSTSRTRTRSRSSSRARYNPRSRSLSRSRSRETYSSRSSTRSRSRSRSRYRSSSRTKYHPRSRRYYRRNYSKSRTSSCTSSCTSSRTSSCTSSCSSSCPRCYSRSRDSHYPRSYRRSSTDSYTSLDTSCSSRSHRTSRRKTNSKYRKRYPKNQDKYHRRSYSSSPTNSRTRLSTRSRSRNIPYDNKSYYANPFSKSRDARSRSKSPSPNLPYKNIPYTSKGPNSKTWPNPGKVDKSGFYRHVYNHCDRNKFGKYYEAQLWNQSNPHELNTLRSDTILPLHPQNAAAKHLAPHLEYCSYSQLKYDTSGQLQFKGLSTFKKSTNDSPKPRSLYPNNYVQYPFPYQPYVPSSQSETNCQRTDSGMPANQSSAAVVKEISDSERLWLAYQQRYLSTCMNAKMEKMVQFHPPNQKIPDFRESILPPPQLLQSSKNPSLDINSRETSNATENSDSIRPNTVDPLLECESLEDRKPIITPKLSPTRTPLTAPMNLSTEIKMRQPNLPPMPTLPVENPAIESNKPQSLSKIRRTPQKVVGKMGLNFQSKKCKTVSFGIANSIIRTPPVYQPIEGKFVCQICNLHVSIIRYSKHFMSHMNVECILCSTKSMSPFALMPHLISVHYPRDSVLKSCPVCGDTHKNSIASTSRLNRHMLTIHYNLSCPLCSCTLGLFNFNMHVDRCAKKIEEKHHPFLKHRNRSDQLLSNLNIKN